MLKNVRLIAWFNFFSNFKLYYPFAIVYFSQVSGSFALGTSIVSLIFISAAAFEVPTGIISDYIGRKKTLILGILSAILAIILYSVGVNYAILATGAILSGLARSFYSGNNDALLHDTLRSQGLENIYHHHLGKVSSMYQIGLAASALMGAMVVALLNFSYVFWLSIIPQLICLALALKIAEPEVLGKESGNVYYHLKQSIKLFIKNPKLRLLSLSSILSFGFGESSYHFRPLFFNTIWPTWALGLASFLSHSGAIIGFLASGRLMDRFGGVKLLLWGSIFNRFIDFFSLIFTSFFSPILMSLTSLHFGVATTVRSSLMQKEFTNIQRATMGSLNMFAGSLFFAVIYFLIGMVADQLNPQQALLLLEFFMLINVFLYWKLYKRKG